MISQRGGFVMGLVVGLLVGLALALGVALYITKAPVPFIDKVPQRTAEQDSLEAERNRTWDPNAPLGGKAAARSAAAASGAAVTSAPGEPPPLRAAPPAEAASAARPSTRDPAALLAGRAASAPAQAKPAAAGGDPFVYFVQAGAYTRTDDAEQQRARLALLGQVGRITEREQAGRTVYRVRLGPYPTREEADALLIKLQEQAIEAQIVRVERP
ncbi:MAG: SPOR domain-containing protein [Rubrivivax sp.]|nr:SPOR domain-containing protein [Rubrivivax sp.]